MQGVSREEAADALAEGMIEELSDQELKEFRALPIEDRCAVAGAVFALAAISLGGSSTFATQGAALAAKKTEEKLFGEENQKDN